MQGISVLFVFVCFVSICSVYLFVLLLQPVTVFVLFVSICSVFLNRSVFVCTVSEVVYFVSICSACLYSFVSWLLQHVSVFVCFVSICSACLYSFVSWLLQHVSVFVRFVSIYSMFRASLFVCEVSISVPVCVIFAAYFCVCLSVFHITVEEFCPTLLCRIVLIQPHWRVLKHEWTV